ncbi:MAG: hypothetical protein E6G17_05325 [Actinobacteria bacterium]|nr:MAG: hypothetical protein E6G17_05325 [Actinomycetota bacterium]
MAGGRGVARPLQRLPVRGDHPHPAQRSGSGRPRVLLRRSLARRDLRGQRHDDPCPSHRRRGALRVDLRGRHTDLRRSRERLSRVHTAAAVLGAVLLAACSASSARHPAAAGTTKTTHRTTAPKTGPTVLQASVVASLPAPVSRAVVVADGDQLVVLGGLTAGSSSAAGVYRVDPSTGALRHLGDLAVATHDAAGARVGREWLVFGGGEAKTIATVQSFDDAGVGRVVGRLPTSRSDLVSASIGDRVYLLGGYDGSRPVADVLETSDGIQFDVVAQLPDPVRYPAVGVVGSKIYLFGGEGPAGATSDIQEVDPASRRARVVGHLPEARSHAAAAVIGGQVVVVGGRVGGSPSDEMLRFDPVHAAVSRAGPLPEAVADAGVAVIGETAYLVGGEGNGRLAALVAVRFATT